MGRLERVTVLLDRWFNWIAGVTLIVVIVFVCLHVIEHSFGHPLKGVYELTGFGGAVVAFGALGYTQLKKANISVDIVVSRLSRRTQAILQSVNYLLCIALFSVAAYQSVLFGNYIWRTGERSDTLEIIFFPLVYGLALGFVALCLTLLLDFLKSLAEIKKK